MQQYIFENTLVDALSQILNDQITSNKHPLRSYYENSPFPEKLFYRDLSYSDFGAAELECLGVLGCIKSNATEMLGFGFNVITFLVSYDQSKSTFWNALRALPEEKIKRSLGSCLKPYSYLMNDHEVKISKKAIALMVQQYIALAGENLIDPKFLYIFNKIMFFVGVAIATDQHLSSNS